MTDKTITFHYPAGQELGGTLGEENCEIFHLLKAGKPFEHSVHAVNVGNVKRAADQLGMTVEFTESSEGMVQVKADGGPA